MDWKKYIKIKRAEEEKKDGFRKGDHIIVQEKIDGANFSIRYDAKTDSIVAYGRNTKLKEKNELRGAWNWAKALEKERVKEVLGESYHLFGEWLVPHSIRYPEEQYRNAFFFDVYDMEAEKYLPQEEVKSIVERLGLRYVPVFYDGPFESWEQLEAFVGQTALGGERGEGVVVKNMSNLNHPDEEQPFYVKLVSQEFRELQPVKWSDEKKQQENMRKKAIVQTVVTEARVRKLLHKMVDAGILPEDWGSEQLPVIKKHIGGVIYHDCAEEEPETVALLGKGAFGGIAVILANEIIKDMLQEKEGKQK